MKSGRRLIRVTAVIAVALGAGHVAQSGASNGPTRAASLVPQVTPQKVTPVAASFEPVLPAQTGGETGLPALPAALPPPRIAPTPSLAKPEIAEGSPECMPLLAVSPRPGAVLDVLLSAPCRPEQRVVLRHAGLAVTYRTNAAGALFASIPALMAEAEVSVLFAGGETIATQIALPEATEHRRFGVQWMGPQTFEVNAFENGADYGEAGHVSSASPKGPAQSLLPQQGFLSILGDATVDTPMLAEIYTYPAQHEGVPVVIEAAVTDASCGREMLGEVLTADRGAVRLSDLSVTMPGCDAVGDYLVLKNLVPDLKLAAAN
jgi:hypothetical protein